LTAHHQTPGLDLPPITTATFWNGASQLLLSEHQAAKFSSRNALFRNDLQRNLVSWKKWKISQCRRSNCTTRVLLASQFCHWHSKNRTCVQRGGYYLHDFETNTVLIAKFCSEMELLQTFQRSKAKKRC